MKDILFCSWGDKITDNRGKDLPDYEAVDHVELPEYFKQDVKIKALIGWYGIILRSSEIDIIDLCKAHMEALLDYSKTCDKCNYCKTGFVEMIEVLQDIIDGEATEEDLEFIGSAAEAIVDSSKCSIGKFGPAPLRQALEYFSDDFLQAINGEKSVVAGTYFSKLTAPCIDACPIHLDIPKYIELIKDAKFTESIDVIRERLPLPGVLGRACIRPCEKNCRRANLDEPVAINHLKRFVADHDLSINREPEYQITPSENTGKVAIVGAGPAGITCAFELVKNGYPVTVFEAESECGGMMRYGIPEYRLPKEVLGDEISYIEELGVEIKTNTPVDNIESLFNQGYKAIFLGTGAWTSLKLEIPDEDADGVIHALDFLKKANTGEKVALGDKVAVIGGGSVAIDSARLAQRLGAVEVNLICLESTDLTCADRMPAQDLEIGQAEEEGVIVHPNLGVAKILTENGKVTALETSSCVSVLDPEGKFNPKFTDDPSPTIQADTVIVAIGQKVDLSLLEGVNDVERTPWNTIMVDEITKQTSRPKIFSAGDCETGPDALITACAGGRKASRNIDRFINGTPLEYDDNYYFENLFKSVKILDRNEEIRKVESKPQVQLKTLQPETRKRSFEEVEQGFSDAEAVAEAERCLKCYQVATIAV